MPQDPVDIKSVQSPHSVGATIDKLKFMIESKGLTLFAHLDHSAGAKAVGLKMQEANVLIFGNAKSGTPLMVTTPLLALDLPLKVLIWNDADDRVWVSFNTIEFYARRYDLALESLKSIAGVSKLVDDALM